MTLRILEEAEREVREASLYYENKQQGLGVRFLERVQRTCGNELVASTGAAQRPSWRVLRGATTRFSGRATRPAFG